MTDLFLSRSFLKITGILLLTIVSFAPLRAQDLSWAEKVGAKQTPSKNTLFNVKTYGAVNDGKTMNTQAIQKAIDACSAKGGGIVTFPEGIYLTGSIYVKKGVHLRIDKGVEIRGSQDIKDYPEIDTRVAGLEMKWPSALINVLDQQNVLVSGGGLINAQGKVFWDYYWALRKEYEPKGLRWIVDYDAKRPRTVLVSNSQDVTIKGLNLQQAGFWTVQILYSTRVTADGLTIRNNVGGSGPSTDGIDVDSSSWILIQNCDIDCNDDDFCLKAGRDWDGLRVNRPTEYVVIRNCIARKGGGLLTLGSETAGFIRHVLATDLTGTGTANCLNIKSATTRGGGVEDIHLRNVNMENVGNVLTVTMNWNPSYSYSKLPDGYTEATLPPHWKKMLTKVEPAEKGIPQFKDVYLSNINIKGAKRAIGASGLKESMMKNFHFTNVNIEASGTGSVSFAEGWKFDNVNIKSKDGSTLSVKDSQNMQVPVTNK